MEPVTIETLAGPVVVRQIEPADREAIADSYGRWSVESRYQRFMMPPSRLTNDQLSYLTEVDHVNHEALVAYTATSREPVGIARYIRLADYGDEAEVAVAVSDDWHGLGVGTALLALLKDRAATAGIKVFRAEILASNAPAHALMQKLADSKSIDHTGGVDTIQASTIPPADVVS